MSRRFRFRITFFLGIVALLIAGRFYPDKAAWPMIASPFIGIAAMIGGASLFEPALIIAVPCLFRRRILCRTLCPLGFCFDLLGKTKKRIVGQNRLPRFFHRFPRLGVFLAVLTWLGVLAGLVGFLWLDPFVLFSSPFKSYVEGPARVVSFLVYVLLVLLGAAWFLPGFWCRCFCPLGGTQDILYFPTKLVKRPATKPMPPHNPRSIDRRRRQFFFYGASLSLFGCFLYILGRSTDRLLRQDRLSRRPPGAIDEATFLALCTRCGACIQACPTGFLKQNKARSFLEIDCPEVFHSATAWCEHDCTACSQACPTGAIRKFSVRDKKDLKLGRAEFEFERCRLYEDVECSICARECPHEAISYEWSEEEYRRIVVVDDEICTGCGRCVVTCPVTRESGAAGSPLKIVPNI